MFIELQSGSMLNLCWLQDCYQCLYDAKVVVLYMVNGTQITEQYATESEAANRVAKIQDIMLNKIK